MTDLEHRYRKLKLCFWIVAVSLWTLYLDCNLDLGLGGILRFW